MQIWGSRTLWLSSRSLQCAWMAVTLQIEPQSNRLDAFSGSCIRPVPVDIRNQVGEYTDYFPELQNSGGATDLYELCDGRRVYMEWTYSWGDPYFSTVA